GSAGHGSLGRAREETAPEQLIPRCSGGRRLPRSAPPSPGRQVGAVRSYTRRRRPSDRHSWSGSRPTPRHPDLLRRPAQCPVKRDEWIAGGRVPGGTQLDQVVDLESAATEETDPVAVVQVELHAVVVRPLVPVHTEVVAAERRP